MRLLATDGYKFSMAEAGFPLRTETFYYAHRKGGWGYVPLDIPAYVRGLLPTVTAEDYEYLASHGYFMGGAFRAAVGRADQVRVNALPAGSWFWEREPVFSVTGPSALVSWLEPLLLQLHVRIQASTQAATWPTCATCEEERDILFTTPQAPGLPPRRLFRDPCSMRVDPDGYEKAVYERARELVDIVGDADRLFEVGLRAASCPQQHVIALRALREAGIRRTSHVEAARTLGMIPVGTMGHEHVQRHGSDRAAFSAMRDRFPGFVSYLLDTYGTLASGIPEGVRACAQDPGRNSALRFDAEHGVDIHYLSAVATARQAGVSPNLVLESGWDADKTRQFEQLREQVGWPTDRQSYGYGHYLVHPPWPHYSRDDVAAVYKLCQSGDMATMKFGDEPAVPAHRGVTLGGKASIPGKPVVWRFPPGAAHWDGVIGWIGQEGERGPDGAVLLTGADRVPLAAQCAPQDLPSAAQLAYSPETLGLIQDCKGQHA